MSEYDDILNDEYGDILSGQPQGATTGTTMPQAVGRKLPPTWDVSVGGQTVRGLYDPEAKAYLVGMRDGTAAYINKNPDGSLGLKPHKGKVNAAGTNAENFAAGAGKAVADAGRGLKQLGVLAGNTLGLVDNETVDQTMADVSQSRARDADLMDTKAGIAGNVAGNVAMLATGGSGVRAAGEGAGKLGAATIGRGLQAAGNTMIAPRSVKGAAYVGGALGLTQPAETLTEKGIQMGAGAAAGAGGQKVANAVGSLARGSSAVRPEVKDLAVLARDKWGINVGNDKLVKSKALDALAAGAEYVPLSGMGKASANRQKQFNQALASTIGQSSDNPAFAIKAAHKALGDEYDRVLQGTAVKADDAFVAELAGIVDEANSVLTDQQFGIIKKQTDNILKKVGDGDVIDAKAAYTIKKLLDKIGDSADTSVATYADDMRGALMGALNRSLGPDEAAAFAKTRGQYSNLIALRKLVPRGAEADISAARLANAKDIRTSDLSELADIAATFLKPREGNSGTMPRQYGLSALGLAGAAPTAVLLPGSALPIALGAAGTLAGGRVAGSLVNSPAVGRLILEGSKTARAAQPAIGRVAPVGLPAFLESYLSSSQQ